MLCNKLNETGYLLYLLSHIKSNSVWNTSAVFFLAGAALDLANDDNEFNKGLFSKLFIGIERWKLIKHVINK